MVAGRAVQKHLSRCVGLVAARGVVRAVDKLQVEKYRVRRSIRETDELVLKLTRTESFGAGCHGVPTPQVVEGLVAWGTVEQMSTLSVS